jgi:parallel beta-helix repeat protein
MSGRCAVLGRSSHFRGLLQTLALTVVTILSISRASAAAYYVNGASTACSDSGAGTSTAPYCTIGRAVADRAAPGVTIYVKSSTYREQITVPVSGTASNPFVLQASGSSVIIDGADSFAGTANWTLFSGSVWKAAGVTWSPVQVFVDGARLSRSTASAASIPANSFLYVAGAGLYVNIGGANPGSRQTLVGHRLYGFRLSGKSYVTIDGFTVTRTENRGIYLSGASDQCDLSNNRISYAGSYGLVVLSCTGVMVDGNTVSYNLDHGIFLSTGSTSCTIQDNESFGNARATSRAANGIMLNGSPGNLVRRNRLHDNQDTGLQIDTGSDDNISLQNMSWFNGDHGFDHLHSLGTTHIGDVAYHNYKDGFSIEGDSPDTTLMNCIAIDNGLTTHEYNLWIDSTSASGFVSNSNIFWNSDSAAAPVKYIDKAYAQLADYTVRSGQDSRSIQADPLFVNSAGGNFHLVSGSPAIDSADASAPHWPSNDADGKSRFDDPLAPNTGIGPPVAYADRGALEFRRAANQAPDGTIDSPASDLTISAGQTVSFAGTGTDPDANLPLTYRWNFGGAAPDSSLEDPGALTFQTAGTFTVTLTVTDALGLADATPARRVVTVSGAVSGGGGTGGSNLVGNSSFEAGTTGWSAYGGGAMARVSGGQDGVWSLQLTGPASTAAFGANDTPNWLSRTGPAGTRYRVSAYVRGAGNQGAAKIRVREYVGSAQVGTTVYSAGVNFLGAWQQVTVDYVTSSGGSALDIQVLDYPLSAAEVFQVDTVSIQAVP